MLLCTGFVDSFLCLYNFDETKRNFFYSEQKAVIVNGKLKGLKFKTKDISISPQSIVYRLKVFVCVRFITQIVNIFLF